MVYFIPVRFLIYGLIDPITRLIRYIGKSSRGMTRPRQHRTNGYGHCGRWVRELQREGLDYEIVVLDTTTSHAALNALERWWIAYGRVSGWPLTNLTDGGDGAPHGELHHMKRPEQKARQGERIKKWWTEDRRAEFSAYNPSKLNRIRDIQTKKSTQYMSNPENVARIINSEGNQARLVRAAEKWRGPDNPNNQRDWKTYWTQERRDAVGERIRAQGDAHPMRTPEGRARSRAQMERLWNNPEFRDARSGDNSHMRRPEHRTRMSGDNNPSKTPEARAKLRAAWTPERRAAQAARCAERNRKTTGPRTRRRARVSDQ